MRIAVAADHAGYRLKEAVKAHLAARGHVLLDFGTHGESAVDYPDVIRPAAESVARGDCEAGIVFGGSGNGEAMVANKVDGIRCALCWDEKSAELAKAHNNANIIALGGRMVTRETGIRIVDVWLGTRFEGGRHQRRIDKM